MRRLHASFVTSLASLAAGRKPASSPHFVRQAVGLQPLLCCMTPRRVRFYAVHRGRDGFRGVLRDWTACKAVVERVPNAVFKSFATRAEAVAFSQVGHGRSLTPAPAAVPDVAAAAVPDVAAAAVPDIAVEIVPDVVVAAVLGTNVSKVSFAGAPRKGTAADLTVYTDGACARNGQARALAGVGVYFDAAELASLCVSEPLAGPLQTNQRAELTAVLRALTVCLERALVSAGHHLVVKTDSKV
jgi:ribonuclease HI